MSNLRHHFAQQRFAAFAFGLDPALTQLVDVISRQKNLALQSLRGRFTILDVGFHNETSVAHATHTTTESRSNNQPSVSPSFFPFLEWLVLKRYGTIGGQRPRWHEGASGRAAITQARLVRGLPLTMTRALGVLA